MRPMAGLRPSRAVAAHISQRRRSVAIKMASGNLLLLLLSAAIGSNALLVPANHITRPVTKLASAPVACKRLSSPLLKVCARLMPLGTH